MGWVAVVAAALVGLAGGAQGQQSRGSAGESVEVAADSALIYEREVFQYQRGGRPDPFRSLLTNAELGVRTEDLTLVGVISHPDPRQSVAVLSQRGSDRRVRARIGDRLGSIRIVAIHPRRIDVVVEEFGVARRETLEIPNAPGKAAQ
jgi:hypothetical protein